MSLGRFLRRWHKWISLVIGIQVLAWCATGLYMVAVDIDFIHGDSLVRTAVEPLRQIERVVSIQDLKRRHEHLRGAKLIAAPGTGQLVYELDTGHGLVRVDAISGEPLPALSPTDIEKLASSYYAGSATIRNTTLLTQLPVEARGRPSPLWRVDFDDWLHTSFYLHPESGALVTRRHRFWRIYDALWMLHIMDYGAERDDPHNQLLRISACVGILLTITGLGLLFFSFRRGNANRMAA